MSPLSHHRHIVDGPTTPLSRPHQFHLTLIDTLFYSNRTLKHLSVSINMLTSNRTFTRTAMASIAHDILVAQATSPDQSHTVVVRSTYQRDDWRRLSLNDAVEDALSKILRFGFDIDRIEIKPATAQTLRNQILSWAKHIAGEIPGYTNWQEIYTFTFDALYVADEVPNSDNTPIGTEADLVAKLQDIELERSYALQSKEIERGHLADHALSLSKARTRQDILNNIAAPYTAANPMPPALALLFRKIRYTYKLRECILGQVGYYNGSLELAAGMDSDFEYHMYLIQMQLRRPADRLHKFKAPKAMAYYTTDATSLLPWNNQFSFSYGYDEFGLQQMPIFGTNYIERKFVEVLRLDTDGKKWKGLCTVGLEPVGTRSRRRAPSPQDRIRAR
ncbi:hypothetical protein BC826DRAFT_639489 [Russula brevipes]|nr:hypothetical protein BC826DRAFT_639489 [Russula brevipes]